MIIQENPPNRNRDIKKLAPVRTNAQTARGTKLEENPWNGG
jgi:hypothetical protein